MAKTQRNLVNFMCKDDMYEWLQKEAGRRDRPMSFIVREALTEKREKQEREAQEKDE